MKNTRKKLFALALAAIMIFMLAACSASSSSTTTTTVSTSVTDENGNTTTNTTTTEVGASVGSDGVTTTNETHTETTTTGPDDADAVDTAEEQTPEEEAAELNDRMYRLYTGGAKGTNADGDIFYFAWNDEGNRMLAIEKADHSNFLKWHGYMDELDDGQPVITGYSEDKYIPYEVQQNDGEDVFVLSFPENGDEANMEIMDFDEFVEDLVNEWVYFD